MHIAMIAPPAWANWAPTPALLLLAAQLRRAGHEVSLFDMNVDLWRAVKPEYRDWWLDEQSVNWVREPLVEAMYRENQAFFDDYIARVVKAAPGMVAISINAGARCVAPLFAAQLRRHLPEVPFVVGGSDCFRSYHFTKHLVPGVIDALCPGEGDLALVDLANAVAKAGRVPVDQPGFLTWDGGEIRDNGEPERPRELDDLAPITVADVDLSRYAITNRVTMSISRGCVRRCAFCNEGANFWKFRTHSARYMVEQLENLLPEIERFGAPAYINFNDSLINGNMEVLEGLCDLILERGLQFTWGGMGIIRPEMTYELMCKMRAAGCLGICWGIESGSGATLSAMRKGISPSLMDQVIREAHAAGLKQYGNLMIGFPGEGPYEFAESMLFAVKNARYLECLSLPIYIPQPNSTVYKMPEHFGMADLATYEWKTVDESNTPAIRLLRRAILAEIIAGKELDQGVYQHLEQTHGVDLSDPAVSGELAAILRAYVQVTQAYLNQAPADLPILVDRWAADDTKGPAFPRGQLRRDIPPAGGAVVGTGTPKASWMTAHGGGRPRGSKNPKPSPPQQAVTVGAPSAVSGWKEVLAGLFVAGDLARRVAVSKSEASRQTLFDDLEQAMATLVARATSAAPGWVRIEQAIPRAKELMEGFAGRRHGVDALSSAEATVADLAECLRSAYEWSAADSMAVRLRRAERQVMARAQDAAAELTAVERPTFWRGYTERVLAELDAIVAPLARAEAPILGLDEAYDVVTRAFVAATGLSFALQNPPRSGAMPEGVEAESFRELVHGCAIAAGAYVATEQVEQLPTLLKELQGIVLPAWQELRGAAGRAIAMATSAGDEPDLAAPAATHTAVDAAIELDVVEELEAVLDDLWDGFKPQLRLATTEGIRPVSNGDRGAGARILDPHMLTTVALDALHCAAVCQVVDAVFPGGAVLIRSEAWATSGAPESRPPLERLIVAVLACGPEARVRVRLRRSGSCAVVELKRGDALVLHEGTALEHVDHDGQVLVGYFCAAAQELAPYFGRAEAARYRAPGKGHEYTSAHYELMPDGEAIVRESAA